MEAVIPSRVVVTGATGLIGRRLIAALLHRGDDVVALSRHPDSARERLPEGAVVERWADPLTDAAPSTALAGADAVIHLLGEPVAQRWTTAARTAINNSRVLGTRNLVTGLRELAAEDRPAVLVSGSASGYYGDRGSEVLSEDAGPGDDFLADVVVGWETEAHLGDDLLRVVCARTGVVLSAQGGALEKMLPFFRLGIGGPVAGGQQYIPWIHVDDVVGAMLHAVDTTALRGPVNLSAPAPVTNADFSRALGRALHRPAVLPVPGLAVKTLYGNMATIVTAGQRAVPTRLTESGYAFDHADLDAALADVLGAA